MIAGFGDTGTSANFVRGSADVLGGLWQALAQRGEGCLMLDFDGTLAPFQQQRDAAQPYPGVLDLLNVLHRQGGTRLVIVSGRRVMEIERMLPLAVPPEIWGCHGWEHRQAGAAHAGQPARLATPVEPRARQGLAQARQLALAFAASTHIEEKLVSLALHWRGLPADQARRMETLARQHWGALAPACGLELKAFDGGLELMLPGRNKGDAVEAILSGVAAGVPAAYLGDDLTDEDAFAALRERGLAVLVREEPRATRAACRLVPPEGLLWFLQQWQQAILSHHTAKGSPPALAAPLEKKEAQ